MSNPNYSNIGRCLYDGDKECHVGWHEQQTNKHIEGDPQYKKTNKLILASYHHGQKNIMNRLLILTHPWYFKCFINQVCRN